METDALAEDFQETRLDWRELRTRRLHGRRDLRPPEPPGVRRDDRQAPRRGLLRLRDPCGGHGGAGPADPIGALDRGNDYDEIGLCIAMPSSIPRVSP